jgi:hypothetical protein
MESRGRTFLTVCGLTLLPLACAIPVLLSVDANFLSDGHSTGWLLCLLAIFSIYCEFKALVAIESKLSGKRDVFWFLRIPVGLISASVLVVSAHAFVTIAVPGIIFGDIPALAAKWRGL